LSKVIKKNSVRCAKTERTEQRYPAGETRGESDPLRRDCRQQIGATEQGAKNLRRQNVGSYQSVRVVSPRAEKDESDDFSASDNGLF
jgi:hypothetical protein